MVIAKGSIKKKVLYYKILYNRYTWDVIPASRNIHLTMLRTKYESKHDSYVEILYGHSNIQMRCWHDVMSKIKYEKSFKLIWASSSSQWRRYYLISYD